LFGGTVGKANGGVTAFAVSANGKLLAEAINNGSILVYETEFFQLIRIYEGDSLTQYNHLEFSSDNCSQLIAVSEGGFLSTFLLKGFVPPLSLKSQYIDEKKIIMHEDKPLLLIPYYNINFGHFLTENSPADDVAQHYQISAATFNPSVSVIAFQNSITVGTHAGLLMKWNSNVSLTTMEHEPKGKIYGTLYGKVITKEDIPFPSGQDLRVISKAT